jgi:Family 4 glycosyl hydrolase C-terminal domain
MHPKRMQPLPEPIAAMIRLQGSINKLLVEAFAEESKSKLLQAVLLEPRSPPIAAPWRWWTKCLPFSATSCRRSTDNPLRHASITATTAGKTKPGWRMLGRQPCRH